MSPSARESQDVRVGGELDRRRFLGLTTGLATAIVAGFPMPRVQAMTQAGMLSGLGAQAALDRTLVVIEMEGGNDALNTLVPQSGLYYDARPTLGLAENDLLTFRGLEYGVNPAAGSLRSLWESGQIAGLYSVGMASQSRSHFVAQDAWRSALPGEPATSGWLGRWLEASMPEVEIPLRAVSLGPRTLAAEGQNGRPVAVQSVAGYRLRPPRGRQSVVDAMLAMSDLRQSGLFGQVQAAIPATVESATQLQQIMTDAAANQAELAQADGDAEIDPTASLFEAATAIVQGELGTQLLYITVPGFDTHAGQANRHGDLVASVCAGVSKMFAALESTGHSDRTMALVVSEFGRRVTENDSRGTDHGGGGLALAVGPGVAGTQIIGEPDLSDLIDGDLRSTIDTRALYANALEWLGSTNDVTSQVLPGDFERLNLLR